MRSRYKRLTIVLFLTIFLTGASVALAQRLAVKVPEANIRSGPDTKSDILWKVEKYHPLEIIEKKGQWYKFKDFEGDEAWIYSPLLGKIRAVITVKEKCNIRSGPGTKYKTAFQVEAGIPFKVLDKKGSWLKIIHADGDSGWIHKSLVW